MVHKTIEWHKSANRNVRQSIDNDISRWNELGERIRDSEKRWFFKENQIKEAIKKGKETFDDEKFLIKRKVAKTELEEAGGNE